jgi:hypothetical protein
MFGAKIEYLPKRPGERYALALTNVNLSNKVYKYFSKIDLRKYIKNIMLKNYRIYAKAFFYRMTTNCKITSYNQSHIINTMYVFTV